MTPRITLATALRVLTQLRRDPRTVALLLVVPILLVTLFDGILHNMPGTFDRVGTPMVGMFPLVSMFLVTSITMLRERMSGTLERLMTTPLGKGDLLGGYALAFGVMSVVQGSVVALVAINVLGLDVAGPTWSVVALAVVNALLGMALGLLVSAFASSEFQAVQFMPAVILPQILLCGLIVPRERMAAPLDTVARVMPMTYAYDALERVASRGDLTARIGLDVLVVLGVALIALALGAVTLPRRTP